MLELIAGVALGMMVTGFLAIASYERGFHDAMYRPPKFRAELSARRRARPSRAGRGTDGTRVA